METVKGALKALVSGVATGGAALAIYLGVDPELVSIVALIVTPLLVYLVPNAEVRAGGKRTT